MKFEILSHEGVGLLRFGMKPEQVRAALNLPCESFQKSEDSEAPSDCFDDHIFAYYDDSLDAEAFEFAEPAEIIFHGRNLLELPFGEVVGFIRTLDPDLDLDEDGFTSLKLGIGSYAPGHEEDPDLPPEGIIVFKESYYEE